MNYKIKNNRGEALQTGGLLVLAQLNDGTTVTLTDNTYDDIGRLKTAMPNNKQNLKLTYDYNVRSWLIDITGQAFSEKIYYNQPFFGGGTAIYNGNISTAIYDEYMGFNYTYDNLSRLTEAENFLTWNNHSNMFYDGYTSSYSYDRNGNITHIWRIEDLALEDFAIGYYGNQRTSMGTGYFYGEWENTYGDLYYYDAFTENNRSSSASPGFSYNANGAMTQDEYKGFTMGYNTLGMPLQVIVPAILGTINYKYSATGEKLEASYAWHSGLSLNPVENIGKPQYTAPNSSLTRQYIGNKVYENGTLKRILFGNGYYSNGNYYFYLRDHVGNNCVVVNANGSTQQGTYYHPFGKSIENCESYNRSFQPYKYGGKEEEQMHGMGLYDFGARQLDEMVPGFLTVDPLCEKYYSVSPYAYCVNNPVNAYDLHGDSIWYTKDNNIITMHVTGKIINQSSDNINVKRAASDIMSGINDAYRGRFELNGSTYTLQTDVQLEAVSSMGDVADSDHLFVLADADGDEKSARGATSMDGGKVMTIYTGDYANDNWFSNTFSWNNTRSAIHEFGHAVGLSHESASGWRNLMIQKGGGTNVTSRQRAIMLRRQNTINRGPNSYFGQPYPYVHAFNIKTGKWETGNVYKLMNMGWK